MLIAISGLIAFADVFSNGKALSSLPWLLWAWIIAQAVALDYQFYITVKRQFARSDVDRFVYGTRWILIAVLGLLVIFVGAIFAVHETQGGAVASSMTVLGIPSIAFMYVRAAAPVLLLFVIAADHALERNEKPVEVPTTDVMSDETIALILSKLAKLDALEQALNAQVVVSEQPQEQPALPEPSSHQGGTVEGDPGTDAVPSSGTVGTDAVPEEGTAGTDERIEAAYRELLASGTVTVSALARTAHCRKETAAEWLRKRKGSED